MKLKKSIKQFFSAPVSFETHQVTKDGEFEGYGSVWNVPIDRFFGKVIMEPGMFADSLKIKGPKNIRLLWQHNTDEPIGVYEQIFEDDRGLFVKGRLLIDEIQKAREAHALMKHEAIGGLSVGFSVEESFTDKEDVTHFTKGDLFEVSAVTFPANSEAKISQVQSVEEFGTIRELEQFLREVGLPKRAAVAVAKHGFKGLCQERDASGEYGPLLETILKNVRGA